MFKQINQNLCLKQPDAVLFDTDNTLYEYMPANILAERAVEVKVNNLLGVNSLVFVLLITKLDPKLKTSLVALLLAIVDYYIFNVC